LKTCEVVERVLKGRRLAYHTRRQWKYVMGLFAQYSEDWPESGVVVNEWLASLDCADITARQYYAVINSVGEYMRKVYKVVNPCDTAEVPSVKKRRRRYFTPNELAMVMGACRYGYDRELILTLIDSTCRIGELAGLRGCDVGEGFIDVQGKTGQRRYRLEVRVCEALRGLAGGEDGFVFTDRGGNPATANALANEVRRVIKRAGITGRKLGPHTLRHSGASMLARETKSAMVVKALLQHDKIETSMEYVHDFEDEVQREYSPLKLVAKNVRRFDGGFSGQGEQLKLGDGSEKSTSIVPVGVEVVESENVGDLFDDMFPDVEDGVSVRPLLKGDDLRLMRSCFLGYARCGGNHDEVMKARELLRRMLRKVK